MRPLTSTERLDTEKVFSDYDLTLVNAFTTWRSPALNEMPELEELYQEMKDQGVGVVGMVLDSVSEDGNPDDSIVQKAQLLKEQDRRYLPAPDPRQRFPERPDQRTSEPSREIPLFVDKDGNIVGDPIMGSNTFDGWKEAVEKQLAALKGE